MNSCALIRRQLNTAYIPGEWSVRQIVHHLPDSHMNSFIRLKLMLSEDSPTLKPYDQEQWALLPDVDATPIRASLLILEGLHERWCSLFESLSEDQWARKGYHPEVGAITVEDLIVTYSDHCDAHYEQIARTLAAGTTQ
ncbi:MAG: DinB family protein [Anaerolineae bacterium]|nr:DinB family protein [Anaerolineae bacterium]